MGTPQTFAEIAAAPSIRRVLVVEDHDDTRAMLRTVLEMENLSVLEAVDGEAAYAFAIKECPDLILMDFTLPIQDGLAATRAIRKHRIVGETPIIFLSGRAEPAGRQAAFEAGCNDFLIKPIDLDEVLMAVRRWLSPAWRLENLEEL
jgi:CheY-like chemotaxis protein